MGFIKVNRADSAVMPCPPVYVAVSQIRSFSPTEDTRPGGESRVALLDGSTVVVVQSVTQIAALIEGAC